MNAFPSCSVYRTATKCRVFGVCDISTALLQAKEFRRPRHDPNTRPEVVIGLEKEKQWVSIQIQFFVAALRSDYLRRDECEDRIFLFWCSYRRKQGNKVARIKYYCGLHVNYTSVFFFTFACLFALIIIVIGEFLYMFRQ